MEKRSKAGERERIKKCPLQEGERKKCCGGGKKLFRPSAEFFAPPTQEIVSAPLATTRAQQAT